jgi:hypothetical protein
VEHFTWLHYKGRLQALPVNIRQAQKWLNLTNTLAYYSSELITAVKSFVVQAQLKKKAKNETSFFIKNFFFICLFIFLSRWIQIEFTAGIQKTA